jgi:glyoxalase superfamily protein
MRPRLDQVVIDCQRPTSLVRFWAAMLGGEPVDRANGWSHVEAPGFPKLSFQPVAEPKSFKNPLHLDLEVDAGKIAAATKVAIDMGATPVGVIVTDEKGSFQVMIDPEGNEFCFVSD